VRDLRTQTAEHTHHATVLVLDNVVQILEERELSQTQAAKLLGVDQPKVSQIYRGCESARAIEPYRRPIVTPAHAVQAQHLRRVGRPGHSPDGRCGPRRTALENEPTRGYDVGCRNREVIMERTIVVNGRLSDSRHVELHGPVTDLEGEAEVVLRPAKAKPQTGESIFDLIARLPGGTRSKEDIDRQIREERGSWGDRR